MTGAGLAFRATKDLDIVLYVEALDNAFVQAFWEFVRAGGYEVQEKSTGEKQFYRFQKPTNANFPFMLELFSRQPDVLQVTEGSHLTPLPVDEDEGLLPKAETTARRPVRGVKPDPAPGPETPVNPLPGAICNLL